MKLFVLPQTHPFASEMSAIVATLLKAHPLGEGVLAEDELVTYLCADQEDALVCPTIDCKCYPLVSIRFGHDKYSRDGRFDAELFYLQMCHEITHLMDRRNLAFGITHPKEEYSRSIPQGLTIDLWNLYINARLARKGIDVESFQQFKNKRPRITAALETCNGWKGLLDSDDLTFDMIVSLAEQTWKSVAGTR